MPCVRQMIEVYERYGGAVAAVMRVGSDEVARYGVIDGTPVADRVYRVRGIVEKPDPAAAPSDLATVHAWILPPEIFPTLARTPPGKDGEIWLVDAIVDLLGEQPVHALEFEGQRYDAGDKLEFLQASIEFGLRRPDIGPPLRRYLERLLLGESSPS
ncbi:MAG: hypothetical protein GEU73_18025 [Chloroflexi bacterium]|nr:hypothetical protein [Chloroflexota bacterium]